MELFLCILKILLIAAAVLLALFLLLAFPGFRRRFSSTARAARMRTFRYAHRGLHDASAGIAENALPAFESAAVQGFGIELDVQLTADGEVVVFHDETLKRVCGADLPLHTCTYAQLQAYALSGTAARIPRFSEVLAAIDGRVPLIVEVKYYASRQDLCEKTAALLDAYAGDYMIESFHPAVVLWWRRHRPQVLRGILAEDYCRSHSLPFPASLLAGNLLLNLLLAPDFAAYRIEHRTNPGLMLYRRVYRGACAWWTIRSSEALAQAEQDGGIPIFEHIRPDSAHVAAQTPRFGLRR